MWLLMKTAWRNLFRQRRRTAITVSAMTVSLAMAIPFYGLILGIREQVIEAICGMEVGHLQIHDPAYTKGRALMSTLRHPDELLRELRTIPGVEVASARVHGYGLLSNDRKLQLRIVPLPPDHPARAAGAVRFGRGFDPKAPWRKDVARACEALVDRRATTEQQITVGTVFAPALTRGGHLCERVRVVGVLRAPLTAGSARQQIVVGLPQVDAQRAFRGRAVVKAVVRGAAPVSITGVLPALERRITFMKDTVVKGRYLADRPAGEILVGWRLARTLKLRVGAPVFVQASSLDMSTGTFYATYRVVGIFKTGVEGIDRTRVFLHLRDAQKLMALGKQAHEIVIRSKDPHHLAGVKARIARLLKHGPLQVQAVPTGTRAGITPLPGVAVVVERSGSGVRLFSPSGLMRRIDRVEGLAAVSRRVYTFARVRVARRIPATVQRASAAELTQRLGRAPAPNPCVVYATARWARTARVTEGQRLVLQGAEEGSCAAVQLVVLPPARTGAPPAGASDPVLSLPAPDGDGDDLALEVPSGRAVLLVPGPAHRLAAVGLESALERRVPTFASRLVKGRFPNAEKDRQVGWVPALLTVGQARALGVAPGAALLVAARDEDGHAGSISVQVVGLLKDGAAGTPVLVLPFFEAQQVDARRLNARAHELALIPAAGTPTAALIRRVAKRLRPIVQTWDEINPGMQEVAQMQDTFMGIVAFIIFAIAAMTVMNTMLMAVFERTREFGVLKSLGMRPRQVFGLILFETLFLALIAVVIGGSIGFLLDHYLSVEGLDLSSLYGGVEVQGTFISPVWKAILSRKGILVPMFLTELVCLVVSLYPAFRAGRLRPVAAMRHHD